MATQLDLTQTTRQYLTHDNVESLFQQMGISLTNTHLTPNGYQARVLVISWVILEKLKTANSFPASELTENNVKPIVDSVIKDMCTIMPQDRGCPDPMPPSLLSRIIWYCGPEFQL